MPSTMTIHPSTIEQNNKALTRAVQSHTLPWGIKVDSADWVGCARDNSENFWRVNVQYSNDEFEVIKIDSGPVLNRWCECVAFMLAQRVIKLAIENGRPLSEQI